VKKILVIGVFAVILGGCGLQEAIKRQEAIKYQRDVNDYLSKNPQTSSDIRNCLEFKRVCKGMTLKQLCLVLDTYYDERVNFGDGRLFEDSSGNEAWEIRKTVYYFSDGVLQSWTTYGSTYGSTY
jgi:hypothetical protein